MWLECGGTEFGGLALTGFGNEYTITMALYIHDNLGLFKILSSNIIPSSRRQVKQILQRISTCVCAKVCGWVESAREHTDGLPPLKYLNGLVHLHKPAESLGLAVLALRNRILEFEGPPIR